MIGHSSRAVNGKINYSDSRHKLEEQPGNNLRLLLIINLDTLRITITQRELLR